MFEAEHLRLVLITVFSLSGAVTLGCCWIVYWVSLAQIRKELSRTAIL
jgi:hypothetical protein